MDDMNDGTEGVDARLGSNGGENLEEGYRESRYAKRPATCGEAIDVPEMVLVESLPEFQVERMFKPAQISVSRILIRSTGDRYLEQKRLRKHRDY